MLKKTLKRHKSRGESPEPGLVGHAAKRHHRSGSPPSSSGPTRKIYGPFEEGPATIADRLELEFGELLVRS